MNDLDLMLLADGEGDPGAADPARASAAERAKIEGIREVGGLVRGHLELSADDAEGRLAGLWDLVERRLDADVRAAEPAKAPAREATPGFWARIGGWFGRYRSQLLTGVATAGAAAAIVMILQPAPDVVTKTVYVPGPTVPGPGPGPGPQPILVRAPAQVESLDVTGGSGTVFTIAADDGDDDGGTTVIWVTPDDVMEGL